MNKTILAFIKFGVVFLVLALIVGKLYDIGIHRPPLKYAEIPLSTIEYIDQMGRNNKDQGLKYTEQGPFDWNNEEDYGYKSSNGWDFEEDDNFVVYYVRDKNAMWQSYAQQILSIARNSIGLLEDLFGRYFYAADMNGRKLAIYLPNTSSLYKETISNLMNVPNYSSDGTAGVTVTEIGPLGCLTKGIVLNPECFNVDANHPMGYGTVLKHEMSHYVFFSALDYSKNIKHYLWVSEGIAEYFCNNTRKSFVQGADSIEFIENKCMLDMEFPNEMNSAYWAGESFYRYMEKNNGIKSVLDFVQDAYVMSTDSIFVGMDKSVDDIHSDWVKSLVHKAGTLSMDSVTVDTLRV